MNSSKNDIAWQQLFEKYKIVEHIAQKGFYTIKSSEINEFREARLMTKFDSKSQLPQIFVDHQLAVLPISRGTYVIANFEVYHQFENQKLKPQRIDFPHYLESIDFNNITSEATALNCAYVTGIIEDFVQEEHLKSTVNGRMSSLAFDFNINAGAKRLDLAVRNAQIEIDGGYEGLESLNLIEAKNTISTDFLIRQIFYPYRLWEQKVNKKVRPLFLTYTNGIFHFREYTFEDSFHYNSIKLVQEKKYVIREAINIEVIEKILHQVSIVKEPEVPFPQADSFDRVINLLEVLYAEQTLSKEDLRHNYDFTQKATFDSRQVDYYINSGRYLGLVDKKREDGQIKYFLTLQGRRLFKLSIFDRQLKLVQLILSHAVFNQVLANYFKKGEILDKHAIVAIMKTANLFNVGTDKTFYRRASTISRWINWILEQIEE